jgi:ribosome production factor 2
MGKAQVSNKLAAKLGHKPRTKRGKRFLEKRAPKVHENSKNLLVLKGGRTGLGVQALLKDLTSLRRPLVVALQRRQNEMHPFEDCEPVEYLCRKNDTSLFCYGSTSKKRPFRLVVGRTFDHELLDMQEYRVSDFKASVEFKEGNGFALGSKPLVVFQGAGFDHDEELKHAKNLLTDLFRGPRADRVCLMGLQRVMVCTALEESRKILVKHYRIDFKKSGTKLPHCALTEIGPRFTLEPDRRKQAVPEVWKAAIRKPKQEKPKKRKNVSTNALGETRGRIHVGKQKLDKIHTHLAHSYKQAGRTPEGKADEAAEEE